MQKNAFRFHLTLTAAIALLSGCGATGLTPMASARAGALKAHAAATLDLLTYNTWGKPGILGTDKKPRFELIGPAIQSHQVVALQETFTDYTSLVIKAANFPTVKRMDKGGFLKLNAGLTTLSKFTLLDSDFAEFEEAGHADQFARKGVMFTRLMHPTLGPIDIYNTHYQAQAGYGKIREYDNSVMAALVKKHDVGYPTFLLGDFNMTPDSPEYADLMKRLPLRDTFAERNPGVPGFTIDPANTNLPKNEPSQRIDYIFTLPNDRFDIRIDSVEVTMNQPIEGRFPSDHFGLNGHLTVIPKSL